MKNDKFRSSLIIATLWLGLTSGCTQVDPYEDGKYCGNGKMGFVRQIEGMRAECSVGAFSFSEKLASNQVTALTCPGQKEMLTALQLKSNIMVETSGKVRLIDSTHAYPYRVWGTIYHLQDWSGFAGPVYGILVSKVEPVY